ncbi:hypothetical protein [Streptomyces sp. A1136]|uniref:hypothetical protein n=1 Tax=Streptomyces sp. A1136 TaxID=2563102 RepID=UPI00109E3D7B|nr:hypothetical protein [Streptomyces sp. A1136]THA47718.1 hypothetical protein E6R62_30590 [Streptomyces sp. A1136]
MTVRLPRGSSTIVRADPWDHHPDASGRPKEARTIPEARDLSRTDVAEQHVGRLDVPVDQRPRPFLKTAKKAHQEPPAMSEDDKQTAAPKPMLGMSIAIAPAPPRWEHQPVRTPLPPGMRALRSASGNSGSTTASNSSSPEKAACFST